MYIALAGIDGCGKDTQADLVAEWASKQGYPVLRTAEPNSELPTGKLLRQLLKSGELTNCHAALFLADRMALQQAKLIPWLEKNNSGYVISARCFLSTLVYQQDQWPLDWLFSIHSQMLLVPNKIIILDLDAEEAAERMLRRNIHSECYDRLSTQKRNRQRYHELVEDPRLQKLLGPFGEVHLVDASGTAEETHQRVMQALNKD